MKRFKYHKKYIVESYVPVLKLLNLDMNNNFYHSRRLSDSQLNRVARMSHKKQQEKATANDVLKDLFESEDEPFQTDPNITQLTSNKAVSQSDSGGIVQPNAPSETGNSLTDGSSEPVQPESSHPQVENERDAEGEEHEHGHDAAHPHYDEAQVVYWPYVQAKRRLLRQSREDTGSANLN